MTSLRHTLTAAAGAARWLPVYLLCIAPAALLWQRPLLLAAVYALCSAGLLVWRHDRADLVYYFVPFVFGPLGELFAVRAGAWTYAGDAPLPVWLPFVWGIAGLFMKNLSAAVAGRRIPAGRASEQSTAEGDTSGGSIDHRPAHEEREASRS